MVYPLFQNDEIESARVIRFAEIEQSKFPALTRLTTNFDLCVLQLLLKASTRNSSHNRNQDNFVIAHRDPVEGVIEAFSPCFSSLLLLEGYAVSHQVDLLHDFLFGRDSTGDDLHPSCLMH